MGEPVSVRHGSVGRISAVGIAVGARVWDMPTGAAARVVAQAQGGLLCRLRYERGGPDQFRSASDLLRLHAA
jgi:hypothetical protein